MTPERRNRLILLVLLVVLGISMAQAFRNSNSQTTAAVQTAGTTPVPEIPSITEGRIRLDWIDSVSASDNVGRKNVFQYGTAPSSPAGSGINERPATSGFSVPPRTAPPLPAVPPPAPAIPLKYEGYAIVTDDGSFTAFLSDDTQHYNVKVGDVLIGRFRILQISTTSVEVEDLQFSRRQTLPIVQAPS